MDLQVATAVIVLALTGCASRSPVPLHLAGVVVDGLNRPVPEATVEIWQEKFLGIMAVQRFRTGLDGRYDLSAVADPAKEYLSISKNGYDGRSVELRSHSNQVTVVPRRRCSGLDVRDLTQLKDTPLALAVTELLASSYNPFGTELFAEEAQLRLPLRAGLQNPLVAERAAEALCYIAEPEDLCLVLSRCQGALLKENSRLAWLLAGAMIRPASADGWHFLAECLRFRHGNLAWEGAVQSLGANGSERALALLRESRRVMPSTPERQKYATYFDATLRLAENRSGGVGHEDLREAVGLAIPLCRPWDPEKRYQLLWMNYNVASTKVMLHCRFYLNAHSPSYAMCFHRREGQWVLMGLWYMTVS